MPIDLGSLAALAALPFDETIDVRSPSEFAEDHIPGATSLPVLSDAERAEVGTLYKQVDPFSARKIGAALVARNAALHLEGPLSDRPYIWKPLVYCWRGGQRSGSFASILSQIGWKADTVTGGYRSYRRLVVEALYDRPLPFRLVLLDGHTGTAKTRLLEFLAEEGAQVIDLERMANHRGSLFGGFEGGQPSQKMFESRLATALSRLDPAKPVYVEAEAAKIGDLGVPKAVWQRMFDAPRFELTATLKDRSGYLLTAYGDLVEDRDLLAARIDRLKPFQSAETITAWHGLVAAGDLRGLAAGLMQQHYDPRYAKAASRRPPPVARLELAALDDAALRDAAARILRTVEAAPALP